MPLALLAGLISFLSPCVLPLVPGYLGFVSGSAGSGETKSRRRIVLGAFLFVLGFTLVFVILGAAFGSLGTLIHSGLGSVIQRILGVVIILLGLVLIGQFGFMQRTFKMQVSPTLGLIGAPLLGIAFGLGWTPCIGPTLAAVLTLSLDGGSRPRCAAHGALFARFGSSIHCNRGWIWLGYKVGWFRQATHPSLQSRRRIPAYLAWFASG